MSLKLKYQLLLLIAIPIFCEIAFLAILSGLLDQAEKEILEQEKAREIVATSKGLATLLLNACPVTGQPLAPDEHLDTQLARLRQEVPPKFAALERALAGKPEELELIGNIRKQSAAEVRLLSELKALRNGVNADALTASEKRLQELAQDISAQITALAQSFQQLRDQAPELQSGIRQQIRVVLWYGLLLNLALTLGLTSLISGRILAKVRALKQNTIRLESGVALLPELKGEEELDQLDQSFHRMAQSLREAQRKQKGLINNAIDVICSVNANLFFTSVSPSCQKVWGYSADHLVGRNMLEIVSSSMRFQTREFFEEMPAQQTEGKFENQLMSREGGAIDTLWSVLWSKDERAFFCIAHDISDRKRVERLKQEFLSVVSHDLQSPLMALRCNLDLILEGGYGAVDSRMYSQLQSSVRSLERLVKLVSDLLDLEKIESGKLSFRLVRTRISDVLERGVSSVAALANEKGVELLINCHDQELAVMGDEDRLVQVLVNLLSNAIKFTRAGEPVEVSAGRLNDLVEVQVKDHGPGVSMEHQSMIFDRFEQVELHGMQGGTGLGLAIARQVVAEHDGQIGVESEPPNGSTFWFRLPIL